MTKVRPLQDRIIVRRSKEKEVTQGGIIIPDAAKEKPVEGEVVAVGNGKWMDGGIVPVFGVKPGDVVLFGKYAGQEISVEAETFVMLREDDLLGVVER